VRLIVALAFASILLIPAGTPAGAGSTSIFSVHQDASDVSTAGKKKKKPKRKAPKKEEYLRAAPSEPPAGAKK
jgi:hypothetical protein